MSEKPYLFCVATFW